MKLRHNLELYMKRGGLATNWWIYFKIGVSKNISITFRTYTWWLWTWKTARPFINLYMASDPTLRCKFNYMNLQPWTKPCRKRCSSMTYLELPDDIINLSSCTTINARSQCQPCPAITPDMPCLWIWQLYANIVTSAWQIPYAVRNPTHEDHRDVTHMAN